MNEEKQNKSKAEAATETTPVLPLVSESVTSGEVNALLRKVGRGEITPHLANPEYGWAEVFAGDVEYIVDGWKVVVFNDCDDFDYIDSVVAPNGRKGEFEDWCGDGENWNQPDDILYHESREIYDAMIRAFIEAR